MNSLGLTSNQVPTIDITPCDFAFDKLSTDNIVNDLAACLDDPQFIYFTTSEKYYMFAFSSKRVCYIFIVSQFDLSLQLQFCFNLFNFWIKFLIFDNTRLDFYLNTKKYTIDLESPRKVELYDDSSTLFGDKRVLFCENHYDIEFYDQDRYFYFDNCLFDRKKSFIYTLPKDVKLTDMTFLNFIKNEKKLVFIRNASIHIWYLDFDRDYAMEDEMSLTLGLEKKTISWPRVEAYKYFFDNLTVIKDNLSDTESKILKSLRDEEMTSSCTFWKQNLFFHFYYLPFAYATYEIDYKSLWVIKDMEALFTAYNNSDAESDWINEAYERYKYFTQ